MYKLKIASDMINYTHHLFSYYFGVNQV